MSREAQALVARIKDTADRVRLAGEDVLDVPSVRHALEQLDDVVADALTVIASPSRGERVP